MFNFKLFKVPYKYKDSQGKERVAYNFFIVCLENNRILRINAEKYKDSKNQWHDNTPRLFDLAESVESVDELKKRYGEQ